MRYFKYQYLLAGFASFSTLFGCKKVIDVNLKNASIQTVITGEITDEPGPYQVIISKTVNFNADNNFPPVSGAFVTIAVKSHIDTLSETSPGIYSTHTIRGRSGSSYSLYVSVQGQVYTATSVMPQPVPLDSISFLSGRKDNLYAVANFQDPAGVANYYQFIEYANGIQFGNGRGNSVFSDRLSDGRYVNRLLYDDSTNIKSGITLTVQMNCIDQPVYNYLNQLLQSSGNGGGFSSPTPANPTSNITGGALGYFSANTITSRSVQIP